MSNLVFGSEGKDALAVLFKMSLFDFYVASISFSIISHDLKIVSVNITCTFLSSYYMCTFVSSYYMCTFLSSLVEVCFEGYVICYLFSTGQMKRFIMIFLHHVL
ncbi:hypothetical protein KP509_20G019100 [Ceratopteris richardii]|uniref:Uncharacterized protein n=1 Tax=Ceratopteris richardii TaxID=49495 RepID=A0A8T2SFP0_CERRI|nr:hypothetical protein KP509_20G019100 [Ceratopteris richardii]